MKTVLTSVKVWLVASRPHTLSAAVVPVLVGSALSVDQGAFMWSLFGLTLLGAILVQIGTNLTDEYADHDATSSAHKFAAPHKVIVRGLLTAQQVRRGAIMTFGFATVIGAWLVFQTGWPLLIVCLVSLLVAYAYSAGPFPLGDYALGELLVFIVMGPVMVGATFYVQTHGISWPVVWMSFPVGGLVTAIMVVNNLRDEEEDRKNGRLTLATVFGGGRLRWGYFLLVAIAYGVPVALVATQQFGYWVLLPWLTLPLALRLMKWLKAGTDRELIHRALRGTAALHLFFGVLLALGVLISGVWGQP